MLNFTALKVHSKKINLSGNFVEYKQFMAGRKRPDLKLKIKPIGVSGIILTKENGIDYVVWAQRTSNVTDYRNFFELVPSGGIDPKCLLNNGDIDYKSKLVSEFSEETGLPKKYVRYISEFALVLDTSKNIYDICCVIFINKNRATIAKYFTSEEYDKPHFVPLKNLDTFVKTRIGSIVPTSIALIEAYVKYRSKLVT